MANCVENGGDGPQHDFLEREVLPDGWVLPYLIAEYDKRYEQF